MVDEQADHRRRLQSGVCTKYVLARKKGPVRDESLHLSTVATWLRGVVRVRLTSGRDQRDAGVARLRGTIGGEAAVRDLARCTSVSRQLYSDGSRAGVTHRIGQSVSQLVEGLPRYEIVKDKVSGSGEQPADVASRSREVCRQ